MNKSSAGRNARADSFMDSAHENFFQKNILARNIKTTCVGNIGSDGFKPTITTKPT